MPICNINEFLVKGFFKDNIMCLDIGTKKWGVALSDPNNTFSLPHKVLAYNKKIFQRINDIIENYNVNLILIGLPLNFDNSLNKKCQSIRDITKHMDTKLLELEKNLPIIFWDESFSTLEAKTLVTSMERKRKNLLDKFAATIILQDFLDFLKKNTSK